MWPPRVSRLQLRQLLGGADDDCDDVDGSNSQASSQSLSPTMRDSFDAWLRERALKDARAFARRYQAKLGVEAAGIRVGDQQRAWGTCGKDKVVRINWRLIQAPAVAMEYVVAHELCHLVERHHGPGFWAKLGEAMPDWRERKAALESWEQAHLAV